jgi:hypothetical protein
LKPQQQLQHSLSCSCQQAKTGKRLLLLLLLLLLRPYSRWRQQQHHHRQQQQQQSQQPGQGSWCRLWVYQSLYPGGSVPLRRRGLLQALHLPTSWAVLASWQTGALASTSRNHGLQQAAWPQRQQQQGVVSKCHLRGQDCLMDALLQQVQQLLMLSLLLKSAQETHKRGQPGQNQQQQEQEEEEERQLQLQHRQQQQACTQVQQLQPQRQVTFHGPV